MREHYDYHSGLERVKEEVRQGEELKKRSMDEMVSYFNQRVSEMNISAMDKVTILGLITAIGFKYEEDTKAAQPKIIDGRLFVTVDDIEKVGCVLVDEHKSNFCRQFYMDAQPEIIRCKDCRKHNVKVGFDENLHTVWKEDACPLVIWRGKAQGHEFDYQYCVFAERKTDGTD